jgi:hypothetical protein
MLAMWMTNWSLPSQGIFMGVGLQPKLLALLKEALALGVGD